MIFFLGVLVLTLNAGIDLVLDTEVVEASVAQKSLKTASGDVYKYGALIIATGATVRESPLF